MRTKDALLFAAQIAICEAGAAFLIAAVLPLGWQVMSVTVRLYLILSLFAQALLWWQYIRARALRKIQEETGE